MATTREILLRAKSAAPQLALLTTEQKNELLLACADALEQAEDTILAANAQDTAAAKDTLGEVMLDRLTLTPSRVRAMADGVRDVAKLPDPVGIELDSFTAPNGLHIRKISVPLGTVGMIYESRPNVTSDAAALCLKSGNACVLKSGKEAFRTSCAIVSAIKDVLRKENLENAVNILDDTSRAGAAEMMTAVGLLDVLIPRGGKGLIRHCVENSRVPCIETGTGICHIYVDKDADLSKAVAIVKNAKTSRPSVCNAAEVCLVHKDIASAFLPMLEKELSGGEHPVEFRVDPSAAPYLHGTAASDTDFDTEFLDYILAVKVVDDLEQAIGHIAAHSTHHSDAIVTESVAAARAFLQRVDSAAVYHNASTRFTDGGEFGFGCEIGISTQKLHARGPMGLAALTSYKYVVTGNGQIR